MRNDPDLISSLQICLVFAHFEALLQPGDRILQPLLLIKLHSEVVAQHRQECSLHQRNEDRLMFCDFNAIQCNNKDMLA